MTKWPDTHMFKVFSRNKENREAAFTAFYHRNFNTVYAYVISRTVGDQTTAADIVQEAFAAAYQSMESFRGDSSERTWIIGIARNKLHDFYRKQMRIKHEGESTDNMDVIAADWDIEEIIIENETREHVLAALDSLNREYKYLLMMKYTNDASIKEIAQIIGRTPKAVDSMLQRAKNAFAKTYQKIQEGEYSHEG
ncbi:MAG: RNA polymerase sigma factor [Clostridia bacterium]|nr:RNA polymerase sigma factor [Clostridia bacterium]